jgi:hypothetical protein
MKPPGPDAPISELLAFALFAKRYEPEERLHDWYGYHGHRFEIVGGISAAEVQRRNLARTNPLFSALRKEKTND